MLVTQYIEGLAKSINYGSPAEVEKSLVSEHFRNLDVSEFTDQRVIIKG
jgi:hypothetical protein